jgi:hypothetical protein
LYRFLASLKLAVLSLLGLSALLIVAMYVDSRFGSKAAAAWVYRSPAFAVGLAFLGVNVLCAAMIRFPWERRQAGFVITHEGIIILLLGALASFWGADQGVVSLVEGEGKGEKETTLLRPDDSVLRVRRLVGPTGDPIEEMSIPFDPGIRAWRPGRSQVLTVPGDPFTLKMTGYLPASAPKYLHEPAEGGAPMIRLALQLQAPGALRPSDPLGDDPTDQMHWLVADDGAGRLNAPRRAARILGPARFSFQLVADERMVWDFLHPPEEPTKARVVRFFYRDTRGEERRFEQPVASSILGKPFPLPDSDLTATITGEEHLPDGDGRIAAMTGWSALPFVRLTLRKGDGPMLPHFGWALLPELPNVMPEPSGDQGAGVGPKPLARITYFYPPLEGRLGLIEVLGTGRGKLYYRVFGRDRLQAKGELRAGQTVPAFGESNQPMQLAFRVDVFLPSGRERLVYVPIELPVGQLDQAIPAARLELAAEGEVREFWVRKSDMRPHYERVAFSRETLEVAYDGDRKPLGFQLELDDFHVGVDPGTQQASSFESKVRLTDPGRKIKDQPATITMNHPLTHRGWTFYQSGYSPITDDQGHDTGRFRSILQAGVDPGRPLKYFGCLFIVIGTFLQFYMKSGVFIPWRPSRD